MNLIYLILNIPQKYPSLHHHPYYKSLLVDVVEIVLLDIREMKKLISSEILKISEDIKITKSEDIEKLTLLKSECQNLLLEITDRELEICDLIT